MEMTASPSNGFGDDDENPGASVPILEAVSYDGRGTAISGDAETVARIHRTDRAYDLFETITLAGLACVAVIASALMVIYARDNCDYLVLGLVAPGWILSLGLSGYTAFRIKVSKSGFDLDGRQPRAKPVRPRGR